MANKKKMVDARKKVVIDRVVCFNAGGDSYNRRNNQVALTNWINAWLMKNRNVQVVRIFPDKYFTSALIHYRKSVFIHYRKRV